MIPTACCNHFLAVVRIIINVLKQMEWPKLTIIAIKEFYETIASHSN